MLKDEIEEELKKKKDKYNSSYFIKFETQVMR
jgi:hypothetical protein